MPTANSHDSPSKRSANCSNSPGAFRAAWFGTSEGHDALEHFAHEWVRFRDAVDELLTGGAEK